MRNTGSRDSSSATIPTTAAGTQVECKFLEEEVSRYPYSRSARNIAGKTIVRALTDASLEIKGRSYDRPSSGNHAMPRADHEVWMTTCFNP
jgi:hypothetical protein